MVFYLVSVNKTTVYLKYLGILFHKTLKPAISVSLISCSQSHWFLSFFFKSMFLYLPFL